MTREAQLTELRQRLQEIDDLRGAGALLGWDQTTYMPPGGAEARGRQLALLSRLTHDRLVDPAIGRLLDSLGPWAEAQGADSDTAALVRVTRRDYERATRVPSAFIHRLSEHAANTYHVWERARPDNDFAAVRPLLETTVELSRELAAFHPGYAHPYDPLIDLAEDGMTVAAVRTLFTELRAGLVPLIEAIRTRPEVDDSCLNRRFSRGHPAGVRRNRDPRLRVRLRARPSGQDRAPVHDQARPRRRAHHHPLLRRTGCPTASSRRCTRPGTRCTSRASTMRWTARRSSAARRRASTKASRGSGRTSSAAACRSGDTGTRRSRPRSRARWTTSTSTPSIARSTRSSPRSSGPRPTRSPTTCT